MEFRGISTICCQIVFQEQVSLFSLLWAGWEYWFQHIFTKYAWLVLESSSVGGDVGLKEKIKTASHLWGGCPGKA